MKIAKKYDMGMALEIAKKYEMGMTWRWHACMELALLGG